MEEYGYGRVSAADQNEDRQLIYRAQYEMSKGFKNFFRAFNFYFQKILAKYVSVCYNIRKAIERRFML